MSTVALFLLVNKLFRERCAHFNPSVFICQIIAPFINVFNYPPRRSNKRFIDIESIFSRSLNKQKSILLSKSLSILKTDLPLPFQVCLIPNQHDHHISTRILSRFFESSAKMLETFSSCDVINKQCADASSIITPRDAPKRLLACGVSDL